jgi:hypothetical protein
MTLNRQHMFFSDGCRGAQSEGVTRHAGRSQPWVCPSIVELDELFIDPTTTIMPSPNAAPNKLARDGATGDENVPQVPNFRARAGGICSFRHSRLPIA